MLLSPHRVFLNFLRSARLRFQWIEFVIITLEAYHFIRAHVRFQFIQFFVHLMFRVSFWRGGRLSIITWLTSQPLSRIYNIVWLHIFIVLILYCIYHLLDSNLSLLAWPCSVRVTSWILIWLHLTSPIILLFLEI